MRRRASWALGLQFFHVKMPQPPCSTALRNIHNTSIAQEHFKLASTAQPLSAETKDPDECINGCQLISFSLLAVFSIRSPKCLSIKFKCALIKKCSEFLVLARGENNALFLVCREIAAWSWWGVAMTHFLRGTFFSQWIINCINLFRALTSARTRSNLEPHTALLPLEATAWKVPWIEYELI